MTQQVSIECVGGPYCGQLFAIRAGSYFVRIEGYDLQGAPFVLGDYRYLKWRGVFRLVWSELERTPRPPLPPLVLLGDEFDDL